MGRRIFRHNQTRAARLVRCAVCGVRLRLTAGFVLAAAADDEDGAMTEKSTFLDQAKQNC